MVPVSTVVRPFSSSWGLSNMKLVSTTTVEVSFSKKEIYDILLKAVRTKAATKGLIVQDFDIYGLGTTAESKSDDDGATFSLTADKEIE